MKKKSLICKKFYMGLAVLSAVTLCIACGIFISNSYTTKLQAKAESPTQSINLDFDQFTYNGKTYVLSEYPSMAESTRELKNSGTYDYFSISGDDPIVSLIPKEYFLREGSHFQAGREWGYYITTIDDYSEFLYGDLKKTQNKRSYLILFDLSYEWNSEENVVTVKVSPLYQNEYSAVTAQEDWLLMPTKDGFSENDYLGKIRYEVNGDEEYTVIPSSLFERKRYYLKDIAYSLSLYNEQAPNTINGNIYSAQTDSGSYFTYMDYEYDGIVRENKEFPTDAVVSVGKNAINIIGGALKNFPVIGNVFSFNKILKSVSGFISPVFELFDYKYNPLIDVSVEKHITATLFNANKDEQIKNYGGLIKNLCLTIKTTADEKNIWFGMGHSAVGQFQINDTAINGKEHNYTRLIREIGFSIVDVETDGVADIECLYDEFSLYSPVFEKINLKKTKNIYILPKGKNYFEFTPEFSGLYEIDLADTQYLHYNLTDSEENTIGGDNDKYSLKGGEKYCLIVSSDEYGMESSVSINFAEGNTQGTIESGEKRIFKTKIGQSDVYTLNTKNGNVLIENIFVASSDGLEEYSGFSGYTAKSQVSVPLPEGEYFIVIHNSGTIKNEYELLASVCESKPIGEEISVKLDDDNFTYFKFSGMEAKRYIATLNDGEDGNYHVLNSELEPVSFDLTDSGVCYFQNYDEVVYIGLKAEEANGKFILNPTEYALAWYIDGELVESSQISLERGETYSLIFVVNGVIQENGYELDLPNRNIRLENNNLIISDACPTGERFRIQFRYNSVAVYASDIEVTVKYTLNFAGIDSVNNGESLTFDWTYSEEDITEIDYSLTRGTETKNYTVYTSGKTVGSTYTEDITSEIKSFTEKFGEVEIKIYRVGVETSKGVEYIDFDSSESVDGTYGGGQGSADNPYLISCNRHFYNLIYNKNNNIYFRLTELLKLNTGLDMFYGHFDGGPTRIEFECNGSADLGLFRNNYGTIEGLHVEADITGNGTYCCAGGIACYNYDSGIIKDCSINFTGTFDAIEGVCGGIAAVNDGKIENCWSSIVKAEVNGDFGGIAGKNRGSIISCYSVGKITLNVEKYNGSYQNSHVGTIVGLNDGGTVSSCYISTGDHATTIYIIVDNVDDKNLAPYVGPIYGQNDGGTVTNCWKDGSVRINEGNLHSFKVWFTKYDQTRNINDDYGA